MISTRRSTTSNRCQPDLVTDGFRPTREAMRFGVVAVAANVFHRYGRSAVFVCLPLEQRNAGEAI